MLSFVRFSNLKPPVDVIDICPRPLPGGIEGVGIAGELAGAGVAQLGGCGVNLTTRHHLHHKLSSSR